MQRTAASRRKLEHDHATQGVLARSVLGDCTGLAELDPEYLVTSAWYHGIAGLLSARLQGQAEALPAATRERLAGLARTEAARDLLRTDATRNLLDLLAGNGIPALLTKGTPLSHLHYGHSYLRPCTDTDLFLPRGRIEPAAKLLGERGYGISPLRLDAQSSGQFMATSQPAPGVVLTFDLHWRLSNRVLFRDALSFDECWARRQAVAPLGAQACALSDADLLLLACLHRIAHGRNTYRNRLIWLYDVHLLALALGEAGLTRFAEAALEKNIGAVCADALAACRERFGTALPQGVVDDLRRNRDREPSAALIDASRLRWAWADLAALHGLRARWAFAREVLANRLPG